MPKPHTSKKSKEPFFTWDDLRIISALVVVGNGLRGVWRGFWEADMFWYGMGIIAIVTGVIMLAPSGVIRLWKYLKK